MVKLQEDTKKQLGLGVLGNKLSPDNLSHES